MGGSYGMERVVSLKSVIRNMAATILIANWLQDQP